jgi:hypothetical protein
MHLQRKRSEMEQLEVDKSYFVDIKTSMPPSHSAHQLAQPSSQQQHQQPLPPINTQQQQQQQQPAVQQSSYSQPSTPTHVFVQQQQQQPKTSSRVSPPRIEPSMSNMSLADNKNNEDFYTKIDQSINLASSRKPAQSNGNDNHHQQQQQKQNEVISNNQDSIANMNIAEIATIIDVGHDTFVRALNNRNRNLNSIRMMCASSGNLKVKQNLSSG